VAKLQAAAGQLRTAEDLINQLETEIEQVQDRADRAEMWLQVIRKEIEEKLIAPTVVSGSEIEDLSP
jgi:lysyl-tRNA synthetase class II